MRGLLCSLALTLGLVAVAGLAVGQGPGQPDAAGATDDNLDEALLQKYQIATDGKGLLDYLQKRTVSTPDPKQLAELAKQLGDDDYQVREQAYLKLMQFGPGAAEALKQASHSEDA